MPTSNVLLLLYDCPGLNRAIDCWFTGLSSIISSLFFNAWRPLFNVVLIGVACREDVRTANIIAADPKGVDCLVLEREYVTGTYYSYQ